MRLWFGGKAPVIGFHIHGEGKGGWHLNQRANVRAAKFNDNNRVPAIFRQPVGHSRTGRAGANNNEIRFHLISPPKAEQRCNLQQGQLPMPHLARRHQGHGGYKAHRSAHLRLRQYGWRARGWSIVPARRRSLNAGGAHRCAKAALCLRIAAHEHRRSAGCNRLLRKLRGGEVNRDDGRNTLTRSFCKLHGGVQIASELTQEMAHGGRISLSLPPK